MRNPKIWAGGAFLIGLVLFAVLFSLAFVGRIENLTILVVVSALSGLVVSSASMLVFLRFGKTRAASRRHGPSGVESQYNIDREILFAGLQTQLEVGSRRARSQSVPPDPSDNRTGRRLLFVTSNGGGLGHVSRTLAIAAEWEGEVRFLTMSKGYSLISAAGFNGAYVPPHEYQNISRKRWGRILAKSLWREIYEHRPALIMFDGAAVYPELRTVTQMADVPFVWLRRGMWKARVQETSKQYNFPETVCDYLIEPGDLTLAYEESPIQRNADKISHFSVSPIISVKPDQVLSREAALMDLGLQKEKKYVLVQLGAGNINNIHDAENVAAAAIKNLGPDWEPVIARSPISRFSEETDRPVVTRYPLATHFRAFEFGVISGGYNIVQEVISLGLPSVSVPNVETITDDQPSRVSNAAKRGLLLEAIDQSALTTAVSSLANAARREDIKKKLEEVTAPEGAYEAAQHLKEICRLESSSQPVSFEAEWLRHKSV